MCNIIYSTGNEQLARSGSNCLENLMVSTGKQFFPDMWDRVCECISDIFTASLPTELLTWKPPERLYRTQSNASVAYSLSSISEAPLLVRSMSVLDTSVGRDEGKDIVTEALVAPEITVVPSSPSQSKETEDIQNTAKVDDTTSTREKERKQRRVTFPFLQQRKRIFLVVLVGKKGKVLLQ